MAQVGKQKLTLTPRPAFAKERVYSDACIVGLFESMQDLHVIGLQVSLVDVIELHTFQHSYATQSGLGEYCAGCVTKWGFKSAFLL